MDFILAENYIKASLGLKSTLLRSEKTREQCNKFWRVSKPNLNEQIVNSSSYTKSKFEIKIGQFNLRRFNPQIWSAEIDRNQWGVFHRLEFMIK